MVFRVKLAGEEVGHTALHWAPAQANTALHCTADCTALHCTARLGARACCPPPDRPWAGPWPPPSPGYRPAGRPRSAAGQGQQVDPHNTSLQMSGSHT